MLDIPIDNTNASTGRVGGRCESPRFRARMAGVFYLLTFVTGFANLLFVNGKVATSLAASVCYLAVTVLFYGLFKPVNRTLSLLAAVFSLLGIVSGTLTLFHVSPTELNSLGFFGFYCLLIGYLIVRSTFLPRVLGLLMALGGLGWLTFFLPALSKQLYPYNMAPGIVGEAALTLWLLAVGLNEQRWKEQDAASTHS
ncbi:MAG TPA: DUF4386 domain-containing protein [Gemmatimonadaceae bacterium]|nr:DUF4386 domain-containing protein [Gemmatimonadaceae bacterium]